MDPATAPDPPAVPLNPNHARRNGGNGAAGEHKRKQRQSRTTARWQRRAASRLASGPGSCSA
eukprot:8049817-Lingulodinium_polyedra.AAC.1